MKTRIKFGTDGWRGITGFDFVDEKIKLISAGVSKYLKERNKKPASPKYKKHKKVVVKYLNFWKIFEEIYRRLTVYV